MQQRNSSVMTIYDVICTSGPISRAALSDATGFSLMTVGKAVDKLLAADVITEEKLVGTSVGRRSGICTPKSTSAMIILDLCQKPRAAVLSAALNPIAQFDTGSIDELIEKAFGTIAEAGCVDIMGIGCVFPDGDVKAWAKELTIQLGASPELIVTESRATSLANSKRFDYTSLALFMRLKESGTVSANIMFGGAPYTGAHGAADLCGAIKSSAQLPAKIAELCKMLDPELIHISCEDEVVCEELFAELSASLDKHGITNDMRPNIIIEPSTVCRNATNGAALLLREKYLLSKLANNS